MTGPACHARLDRPVLHREAGVVVERGSAMKIFVAGATGVLGRRVVAQFVAAGAEVTGIARTPEKAATLRDIGATAVEASLFDPDRLTSAMRGHEVVCNLATAIPSGERAATRSAWH